MLLKRSKVNISLNMFMFLNKIPGYHPNKIPPRAPSVKMKRHLFHDASAAMPNPMPDTVRLRSLQRGPWVESCGGGILNFYSK